MARVTRLEVERRHDGAFADTPEPRLSWVVEHGGPWLQAGAEAQLDDGDVVRIETDESSFVPWPFEPLSPHAEHRLRVRVTSTTDERTPWSDSIALMSTFLAEGEWLADHVGLGEPAGIACPGLLRHEFELPDDVVRARLYATGRGVYQVSINGVDVDDAVLKPGWTAYQHRTEHESTDVTTLLQSGGNAVGIRIAGGWWTEEFGFYGQTSRFYGDQPAVAAQLHLWLADGSSQVIATGPQWRTYAGGPVVSSGIYAGERIDARRTLPRWDQPGFDDGHWRPAAVAADGAPVPQPAISEPVRRVEERAVVHVLTTPSGATVLDFGQNLVGRLRVRVRGPRGHVVVIRHGETLVHGELEVTQLRAARATDELVLSGDLDVLEPEFTFHGFRYAEISGWPGELDPADVTAVVLGSDMRRTGWFSSSEPLLDRFHENVVWGMRGNFLSLPTDCPQRDERLGWTGDIQVFSPTATFLFDCGAFLASWLRDVAAEQTASDGFCPIVVPQVLPDGPRPAAAWGDAATIVPWVLFERLGDRRTLAEQYPSARSWVDALLRLTGDALLWEGMQQFGDWLDPTAPPERPEDSATPSDVVASAYLFRSTRLVADSARELGLDDDAARYGTLADRMREAWLAAYTDGTRTHADTQTSYALAIMFGFTAGSVRQQMGDRLAQLVKEGGYRVGTGFVGTPIVCDALTSTGHADAAGRLLLQTQPPSWLYAVTHGATTVWERWQPLLQDGSLDLEQATSLNHYALGAVADWMHRSVAGLAADSPGYRRIRIAPVPLEGLSHANARHETPYGTAEVGWRRERASLHVHAVVPANTTAAVALPGQPRTCVQSGSHDWVIPLPS